MTVEEVDRLSRRVQENVFVKSGVVLTGIGVYSYNVKDSEVTRIRDDIQSLVSNYEWAIQMHGFYLDTEKKSIRFDLVISFDVDRKQAVDTFRKEIEKKYPDYHISIVSDIDV